MMRLSGKSPCVAALRVLAALLAVLVIAGGAARGYASKAELVAVGEKTGDPILTLTRGMAEIVEIRGDIADIMVADPSIVEITALQPNKLYISGVNFGSTNIIAVDAMGNVITRMTVHVKIDETVIQKMVDELFPEEKVNILSTYDQVILRGEVSTPDAAQKIARLVAQYAGEAQDLEGNVDEIIENMLTVRAEQQVMLRVKVVEASRDVLRELSIDTNFDELEGMANLTGGFGSDAAAGLTSAPLGVANVIYNTGANGFGPLQFIISALEEEGMINTLAEPNLTAISGEQAGFLAGGEVPIPTSRDRDGNILVTYRPFGVALNFRPVVLTGDRISLQLQTEVSNVTNQGEVSVGGITIPAFNVRRASTTVELGSGGSLMIAGLLQSDVAKSMTDLPGIKDVPILGALMSSDSFQREESELVVIVTAFLVKPYADPYMADQAPEQEANPLAQAFADNIRRIYAKLSLPDELFDYDGSYGYLIE